MDRSLNDLNVCQCHDCGTIFDSNYHGEDCPRCWGRNFTSGIDIATAFYGDGKYTTDDENKLMQIRFYKHALLDGEVLEAE